jgi:hypothetical protein
MKWIVRLVIVLALVVIGAGFLLVLSVDRIAKTAIEFGGTEALGTKTSLESIHIRIFGGEASLTGLAVANPSGYPDGNFLSLGTGAVGVSLGSLARPTIEVPKVELDGIAARLDMKLGQKSNAETVLANIEAFSRKFGSGETGQPSAPAGEGKKLVIRQLVLTDISAKVSVENAAEVDVKIPRIELKDIGGGEGVTMAQLMSIITTATVDGILKNGGDAIPAVLRDSLGPKLAEVGTVLRDQVGSAVTGAVDEAKKALESATQNVGQSLEDAGKKAGESIEKGLGDIFKKN